MTVHMPTEAEQVAAVLARAAGRHFGRPAIIEKLTRESGGASRQTWSFDAVVSGQRHGLILRRDPPVAGKIEGERSTSLDRATEFRVLAAAHRAGVRAPEPLFELLAADGLGEAYVMRRIGGTAIARKLLRDPPYAEARRLIAGQPPTISPACAARSTCSANRSRCSNWRSPGSTGASPSRSPSRCWSMATTA